MQSAEKQYDIVLYGASSFVGKITAQHLQSRAQGNFSWALAGRSISKLEQVIEDLSGNDKPDIIVADSNNPQSLDLMCEQARVVISTVGPYALYGEPLIQACIAQQTDYLDLTGEPQWIKRMLDKYQEAAIDANVRLVNCSGFDSIPSDLGVYFLQQAAEKSFGENCQRISMRVHRLKGGASGGTISSMLNLVDEVKKDPSLRRVLGNPYALCPHDHGLKAYQPNLKRAKYDDVTFKWMAPFIMAAINTRIVHRTNALLDAKYGRNFVYDEAMLTGSGISGAWRGLSMAFGLGAFMVGATISPIRHWLENKILPKPGEGPSEFEQKNGMFDIRFYGVTSNEKRIVARVTGDRDPGYGSTAKMLGEAAINLALNEEIKTKANGFLTPASAFGSHLFRPLSEYAGLTFEMLD